jgi:WD40 repeat protein/serine/threonine protein kinase/Flp pilus assembly protein TadD
MSSSSAERDPVDRLAEEFVERYRRGERPSLTEYAENYPEHAAEIRELFPALVVMERLKGAPAEQTGPYVGGPGGKPLERLGDYRIVREVGRGGMGVVYEAEQLSLDRHVALKVLPEHRLEGPQRLLRFHREAKAAARLHHTNIVPVFGVGEAEGLHFYVMQFIAGLGLDEVLRELTREPAGARRPAPGPSEELSAAAVARSLLTGAARTDARIVPAVAPTPGGPPRGPDRSTVGLVGRGDHSTLPDAGGAYWQSVARIGAQVADALAYAHGQGVLHRDVKPSNLLLDGQGNVWVTDFGLAKVAEDEALTTTGDVLGTVRYMAPERFRGHSDARSDVYSLGLTLYELLTRRPAFTAPDRTQLIHRVMHDTPARPREVNRAIPRDLETVVLKAIDRDPAGRYPSAAEMAADLRRFLEDRPIRARRASAREQLWRWCRRNPALACALGLAAVALVAVAALSAHVAYTRGRSRDDLTFAYGQLQGEQANTAEALGKFQRLSVLLAAERARDLAEREEPNQALLWLARALKDAPPEDGGLQLLLRTNLASSPPQRPAVQLPAWQPSMTTLAISPDGRFALRHEFQTNYFFPKDHRLLDLTTGQEIGGPLPGLGNSGRAEFSPDSKRLLTVAEAASRTQLWDAATGRPLAPAVTHPSAVHAMAFSPDGKTVVSAHIDATARLWDAATGASRGPPLQHVKPPKRWYALSHVGFSGDGKTVVTVFDNTARLWEAATGRPRGEPLRHDGPIQAVAFGPGDRLLATVGDKTARLWEVATGQAVGAPRPHECPVLRVAFSPDGQALATGGGLRWLDSGGPKGEVRLWKVNGEALAPPVWLETPVECLLYSPDGRVLLTATAGTYQVNTGTVQFWEAYTGRPLAKPFQLPQEPGSFGRAPVRPCFSADGRRFVTRAGARDVPGPGPLPRLLLHHDPVSCVAFSPDGKRLVTGTREGRADGRACYAYLWGAGDGQPFGQPMQHAGTITVVAFSPDGKLVLTGCSRDWSGQLWEADSGRPHGGRLPARCMVGVGAFSADGRTVLLGGSDRRNHQTARLWDVATGKPVGAPLIHEEAALTVAISPDSKTVVTGGVDKTARLWDAATGRQLGGPLRHDDLVESVAFSPDGRLVLTASFDRTARLWDAATGRPVRTLRHEDVVMRAAFSPDGRTVLTTSLDKTARLWDTATGAPVGLPWEHPDRVLCAAFSPDGRVVATGCADRQARFWAAETGMRIGPPLPHPGPVQVIAFSPAGDYIATACDDHAARLWDVPPRVTGGAERLALWVEAQTGLELDAAGAVRRLGPGVIAERRRRLDELGGPPPELAERPDRVAARHHRVAMGAADKGQWFAAVWHLDRALAARPDDWPALLLRGQALLHLGHIDKAAADYERALRAHPAERVLPACFLHVAEYEPRDNNSGRDAAARERNGQTVLWYLDRMVAACPKEWRPYHRRGMLHAGLGHHAEAEADYRRALPLGPDESFMRDWAFYHVQRREWQTAARDFARAAELGSRDGWVWHYHALLCLYVGDPDGYRRACAAILDRQRGIWDPGQLAVVPTLGPDAIEDMASLARRGDGAALYRAGLLAEAAHRLQEGMAGGNFSPENGLLLAMAHHRLGHAAEAKKWRDKAAAWLQEQTTPNPKAKGQPRNMSPLTLLATTVLLREADDLEALDKKALDALTAAVRAQPKGPQPLVARGRFHANRGHWGAALEDFAAAIRLRPDDPHLWQERARFHARRGRRDLASADFTEAANRRPEDIDLRLECARQRAALRDWEGAALDLARATERRPDDIDLRLECGEAHATAGLWGRAVTDFARAAGERPDDPWNWYLLALAHLGAGDRPGYRATCARMKERFGTSPDPEKVQRLLMTCVVTPDPGVDLSGFLEVAQRFGWSSNQQVWWVLGPLSYRVGQFDDAAYRLQKNPFNPPARFRPLDYLFLAMAHHRLRKAAEARAFLGKAVAWMDAADKQEDSSLGQPGPRWDHWRERVMARVLRREAEELINKAAPR